MYKRILILLFFVFVGRSYCSAQDNFFNIEMQKKLYNYVISHNGILSKKLNADEYDGECLGIMNLMTRRSVIANQESYEYGIYSFYYQNSTPVFKHILLKHGNEYEIFELNGSIILSNENKDFIPNPNIIEDTINDLFVYFRAHPEVSKRLLPLYLYAIIDVYCDNEQVMIRNPSGLKNEYEDILSNPDRIRYIE